MSIGTLSKVENEHYHGKHQLTQKSSKEILGNSKSNINSV